jgi:cellulose synthase/poly-beta-1,6-N-acetylglucosamine synthase-like glycosyltransferase
MIAVVAALAVGSGFLGLGLAIEERRRRAPRLGAAGLPPLPASPEFDPAAALVLLPVRNEAVNVEPCMTALLALAGKPRVRVIDDDSADATARMAAALAAREPRLTLLAAGPLPAGWRGKVHALWVGSQEAGADWLLLVDADVRVNPAALDRALAAAESRRLDVVSLAGRQEAHGVAENLLIPPVFALLDAQLGDWEAAAEGGGAPVANGQFLLLRRTAWEKSGGFAAIRHEVIDDVAIVTAMRRHGHRTGFFRAPELLSVRMYHGFREATRGWRRNLGGLLGPRRTATAAILAVLVAPALAMAAALATGRGVAATILWTAGVATSGLLRTGSGHSPAWALLYPLDALMLAAVLAAGTRDRRRGHLLSWKGRELRM